MLWTGAPKHPQADARNAVFYGDKAIDRSPCGTGTSARMAQLHAKGRLKAGDGFVHELIIGSLFKGRVEKRDERRRQAGHHPVDRRLGAHDRAEHDLHRRPRPFRARLHRRLKSQAPTRRRLDRNAQGIAVDRGYLRKNLRESARRKPIRQRHCVVPMIASAIVQWPGSAKGMAGAAMGRRLPRSDKMPLHSGLETLGLGAISKRNATARRHSRGAAYRCNISSSSF